MDVFQVMDQLEQDGDYYRNSGGGITLSGGEVMMQPSFAAGDDYGAVMPPADFSFSPYMNHENGSWYGYNGWSRNFYTLMSEHPVFIDPCDAFPNRWMNCMSWLKGTRQFNPDYSYAELVKEQELCGIVPGIGSDAHFGGDYRIDLELGWGASFPNWNGIGERTPDRGNFMTRRNWLSGGPEMDETDRRGCRAGDTQGKPPGTPGKPE
jgi:hypothetical protein